MRPAVQGIIIAVALFALGAASGQFLNYSTKAPVVENGVKIIGPASVGYPGQYAAFHVDVPGRQVASLIVTWSVEPLCPLAANQPLPSVRPTTKPGEAQLDTVSGRWRLSASVADPALRTGEIVSIEVFVPRESPGPVPVPPQPLPNPTPQPAPSPAPNPTPGPQPTPPPLPPVPDPVVSRFAQFTSDVSKWLSEVNSHDKAQEAMIAAGALEVAQSLKTGSLSHLSGLPLRIAVASEVMSNNNKVKNLSAWSQFGQRVNNAAGSALKAGRLSSASDWSEFLTAFSAGLKS